MNKTDINVWEINILMIQCRLVYGVTMFNATLNNISVILWQSLLLVEEKGDYSTTYISLLIFIIPCMRNKTDINVNMYSQLFMLIIQHFNTILQIILVVCKFQKYKNLIRHS
jgi:hypothetical protein